MEGDFDKVPQLKCEALAKPAAAVQPERLSGRRLIVTEEAMSPTRR